MDASVAKDLRLGEHLFNAARGVVRGLPTVARGAAHAADAVMAPIGALGQPVLGVVGRGASAISQSPSAMKTLVGLGVLAPPMLAAAQSHSSAETQKMLASSQFPERTVIAHLNNHFMKTSGDVGTALGHGVASAMFKGIGGGLGTGLTDMAFGGAKMLGGAVLDSTVTAPRREKIFYEAMRTDTVLRDALRSNPDVLKQLKEAFSTLVRFAPSLSLDINAVRSYLREAIISGGGINYATIKQLADTEKVIQDRNRGNK